MTTPGIRPLVAGNWKMNGLRASLGEIEAVARASGAVEGADLLLCVPATLLGGAAGVAQGSALALGGQDCHAKESGAHTGDVSAAMLRDAGAAYVIVGHSERRADHGERDGDVHAKAQAAWNAGLVAVICVGETEGERRANVTLDVVGRQVAGSVPEGATPENTVLAYEPVWAIGTGLTPTAGDVAEVHAHLRETLAGQLGQGGRTMRILYGGSVKPSNAAELLAVANVDGALVGGASLKATDFLGIAAAYGQM